MLITLFFSSAYSYTIWPQEEIVQTQQGIDSKYSSFCSFFNLSEIMFLWSRSRKIIYRTKQLFLARTTQAMFRGFGLGSVYVKVGRMKGELLSD